MERAAASAGGILLQQITRGERCHEQASWPDRSDLVDQRGTAGTHQPRSSAGGQSATIGRYDQHAAWVRRVAATLAVSAFRRRLAEARALVHLAARREPDPPLQPEAVDFWRAVRSLPSRQRQAVALFYLEDWPTAEIARFLGCTETTVRGHLHRGRAALARRLGEGWEES